MRIGIDAMGSDGAPAVEVRGALAAVFEQKILENGDRLVLVGPRQAILKHLDGAPAGWRDFIEIHDTSQVITMSEQPVEALRAKPDSSIMVLARMHRDGELDGCISAGNTGACVASAQMMLRRLPGVHRPGITIITPMFHGPLAICDVGANIMAKPQHLMQYGVMASLYLATVCKIREPRVGLLSVGEEDAKGNELIKKTRQLLRDDPNVNFIGNVEGRDFFRNTCDVVVCDGFVGNVVIKLMEGMAGGIVKIMTAAMRKQMPDSVEKVRSSIEQFLMKWDFNEYGGAPLLGVGGIYIICHGASDHRGIMNAVKAVKQFVSQRVNEQIISRLSNGREAHHA
ncbi:MAG: phosphate acyltransferase PlsX [Planctomycetes bacterium]|nr:phosphate acyltransferase PlsX [Planctomycetota bacterium]